MRHILFTIIICLISFRGTGQNIKIVDLFKLYELDPDQIENFALRRGFDIAQKRAMDANIGTQDYSRTKSHIYQSIIVTSYSEFVTIKTAYLTQSAKEYILLKDQIKQLGYRFHKTLAGNEVTLQIYKKRNSKYSIRTSANFNQEINSTLYFVYVVDDSREEIILGYTGK